ALLVDVPLGGFRAYKLQGAGGVFEGRLHRRLKLFFDAVLHVTIVNCYYGDALVEERFGIDLLVSVLPAAAVDVEDDRRRLVRLGREEIQDLTGMFAVRDVNKWLGFVGPNSWPCQQEDQQGKNVLHS